MLSFHPYERIEEETGSFIDAKGPASYPGAWKTIRLQASCLYISKPKKVHFGMTTVPCIYFLAPESGLLSQQMALVGLSPSTAK